MFLNWKRCQGVNDTITSLYIFPAKMGFELAEALTSLKEDLFVLATSGKGLLASSLPYMVAWAGSFM